MVGSFMHGMYTKRPLFIVGYARIAEGDTEFIINVGVADRFARKVGYMST